MAYRTGYRRGYAGRPASSGQHGGALVTPRQAAALDRMAAANGFTSGTALLCDVASCDAAELGRKSRPVVQMFVDQAFARYGTSSPRARYGYTSSGARMTSRCTHEDYPCCGC